MQEYLGLDATVAFQGVGHSQDAIEMMEPFLIGILPKSERAYYTGNRWTEMWWQKFGIWISPQWSDLIRVIKRNQTVFSLKTERCSKYLSKKNLNNFYAFIFFVKIQYLKYCL